MSYMPVTFEVSKLDTLREVKAEQLRNMLPMSVTFEVAKLDTSREVKAEQL